MSIEIINPFNGRPLIKSGDLYEDDQSNKFYIKNGVIQIEVNDSYTKNFSFQWKKFNTVQLDRFSGRNFSKERLFKTTEWHKEDLAGKNILEVGCGAGRFTEVILNHTEANLYSLDYSDSVFVNAENNKNSDRLTILQASIYNLPFSKNSFDKVFCFGVLQHTPDFEKSVQSLIEMVKPGGELVVDFYPKKGWYTKMHSKYIFRPYTSKMDYEKLLNKIEKNADGLIRSYKLFDKIGLGKVLNRFLPICDIKNTLPDDLSYEELRNWVILDTFDMLSPAYDNPQKISTVKSYFSKYGMKNIKAHFVSYGKNLKVAVVKGFK